MTRMTCWQLPSADILSPIQGFRILISNLQPVVSQDDIIVSTSLFIARWHHCEYKSIYSTVTLLWVHVYLYCDDVIMSTSLFMSGRHNCEYKSMLEWHHCEYKSIYVTMTSLWVSIYMLIYVGMTWLWVQVDLCQDDIIVSTSLFMSQWQHSQYKSIYVTMTLCIQCNLNIAVKHRTDQKWP